MPAIRLKGEREVVVGDRTLSLVFSFRAMALIEQKFDRPFLEFGKLLEGGLPWDQVPTVFWIGLQQRQPEISLEEATDLAGMLGVVETVDACGEAFLGAFPPPPRPATEEAAPEGAVRPPASPPESPGTSASAGRSTKASREPAPATSGI